MILFRLLKNAQMQVVSAKSRLRGLPKSQGVRRTWTFAATTKDEGNAEDGRFSAAC
jgi:hypothetical protein